MMACDHQAAGKEELEQALVRRLGCRGAVAVNSCTAALHLALVAAEVGEGDEVITSPYTFASTGETILYRRARPVFVDVEPETANIDVSRIEAAITPRTRAILPAVAKKVYGLVITSSPGWMPSAINAISSASVPDETPTA